MKSLKFISILTTILLINLTILSQTPEKTPEKTPEEINPCNQETALQLVANQVIEANKKTSNIKLIKTMIRAAEFTWDLDETKGREYYKSGFASAKKHFAENGLVRKTLPSGVMSRPEPDYRFEIIRSIAKRDGKWARKLTDELLEEYEKSSKDRNDWDKGKEIREIMDIATKAFETNPSLTNYLFSKLMKYPLDSHWFWGLQEIAEKDQSYADNLYRQLIANYRTETPSKLLFLSAYPFNRDRIMGADKYQFGGGSPKNATANPALQVEFANTFFNRINQLANDPKIMNQPAGQFRLVEPAYMVSGLRDLEPYLQELPQLLPAFQLANAKANTLLTAENREKLDSQDALYAQVGMTFEERIAQLEELDGEGKLKDSFIVQLIIDLEKEEQFQKSESWLDKIENEKGKIETVNMFYHKRSETALEDENFADAKKYADKVPELEFRAYLYFNIAKEQNKNYSEAADMRDNLIEVSILARKTKDSVGKAQVLLGLANMYEEVEHFAALNEIGDAVSVINKLENPDIFSSTIYRQVSVEGLSTFSLYRTPGYNLENAFGAISKNDFNLTMAHAQSLNDSYFQTLAVLAIAKNCVENSKKLKKKERN